MLEEMGLAYELKMLPFPPRVFAKDYLALNPLGTIPYLIDGETRMTESSGICHYLGITYGSTPLMVGPEDPAYGAFLNWMYFSDATLTFPQTLVLRYTQLEPEERRNPQVATDYAKWFLGRLRAVEAATGKAETLCAGRSRRPTLSSVMPCGSPTRSGSPRISGRMSRPIGPAAATRRLPAGGGRRAPRRGGAERRAPRSRFNGG